MKLEIKLKDPKFCDGCPCYYGGDNGYGYFCNEYGDAAGELKQNIEFKIIRPQKCIDENGL
jgi:hypothetical protein